MINMATDSKLEWWCNWPPLVAETNPNISSNQVQLLVAVLKN